MVVPVIRSLFRYHPFIKKSNIMGRKKIYNSKREAYNAWYQNCKENNTESYQKKRERVKKYYQLNKEKIKEQVVEWLKTPMGRARHLILSYKREDKKYNRGECTLTPEWIVEHIFSQPCHYCGESDWTKIGCDRKDSSLPHTPDNVVPCCRSCNCKKHTKSYEEYIKLIHDIN